MLIVLGADPLRRNVNPERFMEENTLSTELDTALIASQLCLEKRGDTVV